MTGTCRSASTPAAGSCVPDAGASQARCTVRGCINGVSHPIRHPLCQAIVISGKATCHAPASLAAGSHGVTAAYTGNFAPSTAPLRLVVAKARTAVRLSLPRSVRHGRTATARVSGLPTAATGTVVLTRAGHRLCTARAKHGVAQCRFTAPARKGTYTLTATYRGDANHAGSRANGRLRVS